jgi:hypothetical protein
MSRAWFAAFVVSSTLLAGLAPADEPVATPAHAKLGVIDGWPTSPSAAPTAAEWASASPVPMVRPNAGCSASRVREWLRVSCRFGDTMIKGIRVIAGAEDVKIEERPLEQGVPRLDQWGSPTMRGSMVVFPVRPGDRRLIEFVERMFEGRYTSGEDAAAVISAVWLPGEAGPTIVVN